LLISRVGTWSLVCLSTATLTRRTPSHSSTSSRY
jgi:hypothetical protein